MSKDKNKNKDKDKNKNKNKDKDKDKDKDKETYSGCEESSLNKITATAFYHRSAFRVLVASASSPFLPAS